MALASGKSQQRREGGPFPGPSPAMILASGTSQLRVHSPKGGNVGPTVVERGHLWVGAGHTLPEVVGTGLEGEWETSYLE